MVLAQVKLDNQQSSLVMLSTNSVVLFARPASHAEIATKMQNDYPAAKEIQPSRDLRVFVNKAYPDNKGITKVWRCD